MTSELRVNLEIGPKGKRVAAFAPDWPGLERGDKTREAVLERLENYLPRYGKVAELASMGAEFGGRTSIEVVEEYPGVGSTDFWGISFAFSSIDKQEVPAEELERELTLMQACWTYFDSVRARVSAEMEKGPRGGGRDRDAIVRHTIGAEREWAKKVGVRILVQGEPLTDDVVTAHRNAYVKAIRAYHADGKSAGRSPWEWPLRYLIRHTAYHTLDHAWEMEDKDLTAV